MFSRVDYCKLSGFLGITTLTSSLPLSPLSFKSVPLSELAAYEGAVVLQCSRLQHSCPAWHQNGWIGRISTRTAQNKMCPGSSQIL